jgi:hypothetical protein
MCNLRHSPQFNCYELWSLLNLRSHILLLCLVAAFQSLPRKLCLKQNHNPWRINSKGTVCCFQNPIDKILKITVLAKSYDQIEKLFEDRLAELHKHASVKCIMYFILTSPFKNIRMILQRNTFHKRYCKKFTGSKFLKI